MKKNNLKKYIRLIFSTIFFCLIISNSQVSALSTYGSCDTPDITVGEGSEAITIAACNVGTNEAGFGEESYGGLFQWGNNSNLKNTEIQIQTEKVTSLPSNSNNSNYSHDKFVALNTTWNGYSISISNLWGNDTDTNEARKGPCEEGYHVPTVLEWENLLDGIDSSGLDNDILLLPTAGFIQLDGTLNDTNLGKYHTSVPNGINKINVFASAPDNTILPIEIENYYGISVRCFKNEPYIAPNISDLGYSSLDLGNLNCSGLENIQAGSKINCIYPYTELNGLAIDAGETFKYITVPYGVNHAELTYDEVTDTNFSDSIIKPLSSNTIAFDENVGEYNGVLDLYYSESTIMPGLPTKALYKTKYELAASSLYLINVGYDLTIGDTQEDLNNFLCWYNNQDDPSRLDCGGTLITPNEENTGNTDSGFTFYPGNSNIEEVDYTKETVNEGKWKHYEIYTHGANNVEVNLTDINGNVNLYMAQGDNSADWAWDCQNSNYDHRVTKTCSIDNINGVSNINIWVKGLANSTYEINVTLDNISGDPSALIFVVGQSFIDKTSRSSTTIINQAELPDGAELPIGYRLGRPEIPVMDPKDTYDSTGRHDFRGYNWADSFVSSNNDYTKQVNYVAHSRGINGVNIPSSNRVTFSPGNSYTTYANIDNTIQPPYIYLKRTYNHSCGMVPDCDDESGICVDVCECTTTEAPKTYYDWPSTSISSCPISGSSGTSCSSYTSYSCSSHTPPAKRRYCAVDGTGNDEVFTGSSYADMWPALDSLGWPTGNGCVHGGNIGTHPAAVKRNNDYEPFVKGGGGDDVWISPSTGGKSQIFAEDGNDWYYGNFSDIDSDSGGSRDTWYNPDNLGCGPDWTEITINPDGNGCSRDEYLITGPGEIHGGGGHDVFLTTDQGNYEIHGDGGEAGIETIVLGYGVDNYKIYGDNDATLSYGLSEDEPNHVRVESSWGPIYTLYNHSVDQLQFAKNSGYSINPDFFGYGAGINTLKPGTDTFKYLGDALHVAGDKDIVSVYRNYSRRTEPDIYGNTYKEDDIFPFNKDVTISCGYYEPSTTGWKIKSCDSENVYVNLHSGMEKDSIQRFVNKPGSFDKFESSNFAVDNGANITFNRVDFTGTGNISSRVKVRGGIAQFSDSVVHDNYIGVNGYGQCFVDNSGFKKNGFVSYQTSHKEGGSGVNTSEGLSLIIRNKSSFHNNEYGVFGTGGSVSVENAYLTGHIINIQDDPLTTMDESKLYGHKIGYGIWMENGLVQAQNGFFGTGTSYNPGNEVSIYLTSANASIASSDFYNSKIDESKSRKYGVTGKGIYSLGSNLSIYGAGGSPFKKPTAFFNNNYPIVSKVLYKPYPEDPVLGYLYTNDTEFGDGNGIYEYKVRLDNIPYSIIGLYETTIESKNRHPTYGDTYVNYDYIEVHRDTDVYGNTYIDYVNILCKDCINDYNKDMFQYCEHKGDDRGIGGETYYYICEKVATPAIHTDEIKHLYIDDATFFHDTVDDFNIRTTAGLFVSTGAFYYDGAHAKNYDVDNSYSTETYVTHNTFIQSEFSDTFYFLKVSEIPKIQYFGNKFVNNSYAHNFTFLEEDTRYEDNYNIAKGYGAYMPSEIRTGGNISYVENDIYRNTPITSNIDVDALNKTKIKYGLQLTRSLDKLDDILSDEEYTYTVSWVDHYINNIYNRNYEFNEDEKNKAKIQFNEIISKINGINYNSLNQVQRYRWLYLESKAKLRYMDILGL